MITAFLPFRYEDKIDVETSLQFYAERRTMNAKGVTIPSQVRFVRYFASIIPQVKAGLFDLDRPRSIAKITIDFPPNNFWTNFVIINRDQKYSSKDYYPVAKQRDAVNLTYNITPNFLVNREVKVMFFDEKEKGAAFYFWFHTYWIKGDQFALRANEVDKAKPKGGYDAKFNVCVHFLPEEPRAPKKTISVNNDEFKLKKSSSDVKRVEISEAAKPELTSSSTVSNSPKKKPLPLTPAKSSKSNDLEQSRNSNVNAPSTPGTPSDSSVPGMRRTGPDPLAAPASRRADPLKRSQTHDSDSTPSAASPSKPPRELQAKITSITTNF